MISNYYTNTVGIYSATRTSDSQGGYTTAYTFVKNISCMVQPKSALNASKNGQIQPDVTHVVFCAYDATITSALFINYNSEYYRIIEVLNPANQNHHMEIQVQKI